jgi:acetyl-CoA acetyltransferase
LTACPWSALEALVQASYHHAQQNPDAVGYGRPLDHETYAGSRWVSEPLRLYDCSRENDGAAAVLVTSAERARDLRQVPAFVLSGVQGAGPDWSESAENNAAYTSAGFHPAMMARMWAEAGVKAGIAEGFVHGIGLILEAVRQVRGTSASQVPGADVSLLLGGPIAPLVSATVFGSAATV